MKLSFHGAAQTVTGSKHLLTLTNGKKILLDCGLFQGGKELETLNLHFGFIPSEIDALVLSHAHIDHSGLIPKLVREGFSGPIYCSHATADLVKILLKDSAKIQEEDTIFLNKRRRIKGLKPIDPLYVLADVEKTIPMLHIQDMNKEFEILPDSYCTFTDAGHILGSCVVNLRVIDKAKQTKICFTGDIGRYSNPIIKNPEKIPQADYIICESTYGDSLHDEVAISDKILGEIAHQTCVVKKGKLIIPAFSVGRTQELVYAFNRLSEAGVLPPVKVYVDSPLSYQATQITRNHPECFNRSLKQFMENDHDAFDFKGLEYITEVEDSKALNARPEPCIIISASGMAEFGRIKHHIANAIDYPRNTILIVGYCEPNSLGARLQSDQMEVRIFGEFHKKNAEIQRIKSFSAHGDYADMLHFLSDQNPKAVKTVFLVHGEYGVQLSFKSKLIKKGFDFIEIPSLHKEFFISA